MFEVHCIKTYDEGTNIGRAIVIMNINIKLKAVEFIYIIDENGNWSFHYETGICITDEVRIELEKWFIADGLKYI